MTSQQKRSKGKSRPRVSRNAGPEPLNQRQIDHLAVDRVRAACLQAYRESEKGHAATEQGTKDAWVTAMMDHARAISDAATSARGNSSLATQRAGKLAA